MAVEWAYTTEFYAEKGIAHKEEFITNSRKMNLLASSWVPAGKEPKALVFLLHGYAVDTSLYWQDTGVRLAEHGYGVFGLDFEGHGRSDGKRGYLQGIDSVVNDCSAYFKSIKAKEEYANKPSFLYGLSMGGAVVLLLHRKEPEAWSGAVMIAPMVKISEKLKPPAIVVSVMKSLAYVLPSWQIVPSKDVIDEANKDPVKRERIRSNPYTYQSKPRLATGLTLLNVCDDLESRLEEVTIPFLLLHGEADTVTDPSCSQALFDKAKSFDKTFKLYPGMWHSLTEGELDDNIEIVFKDIIEWLDKRSSPPVQS